ncbi:uncharacterized protein C12orf56-like [Macrobrachium rosenbergii]|uniref:uncharacterized protein C12orf56-like n=1 Tax=Macrobrachium rosenbergii TaxID=79674 RepID=UPI0034D56E00
MNGTEDRKVRNNKLEYFLKKNLHPNVYSNIRWYEAVIVRTGNTLAYKQAVVSGEDVYLTETPPRSLMHLLHSSQITQVQLVHDLPEFLRGGIRDQTTHITIQYHQGLSASLAKTKAVRHPQRTISLTGPSTSSIDEENEDDSDAPDGGMTDHQQNPVHMFHSSPLSPPPSLLMHNEDTSRPSLLHHVSVDALSTRSDETYTVSRSKDWLMSPARHRHSTSSIISSHDDSSHRSLTTNHMVMSPINGAKSPVRSRSPELDSGTFEHGSLTPTIADLLTRVSGHGITRSMTPEGVPRSRMPRSVSSMETYHSSSPLHLELPNRSKSVLDRPSMPGEPPKRSQSLNFTDVPDGRDDVKEVHFYTLSTSTLLFHLLHSLWVASSLKQTLYEGKLRPPQQDLLQERDIDMEFTDLQTELLSAVTIEDQFSRLQELQQGATKYYPVRRLFWKDPNMLQTLRGLLKQYSKCSKGGQGDRLEEDDLQERQDELELLAFTLETLSTCLQGTQRCPLKMKALQQDKNDCLKDLITEVITVPEVPAVYNFTCTRWLTDFRELASNAWENLPESELLRLVQEVIHTSVGCLYELFSSVNELSWVTNTHSPSNEVGPSLTAMLQHAPVEEWLSYGVPQLLVLLQPERAREINGSEACLTHQYCSVLNTLLHHSPQALHYCTTHYAEELRYYVQESVVSCRLGKCHIRPHTLKIVRTLAQLVMSKNTLRSR